MQTIVLIDDEEKSRRYFGEALERTLGVRVKLPNIVIGPGRPDEEQIGAALSERPDLVIIDVVWTADSQSDRDVGYYDFAASRVMRRVLHGRRTPQAGA
jgi:hypothetical protein